MEPVEKAIEQKQIDQAELLQQVQIKQSMINHVSQLCKTASDFIKKLPLNQNMKHQALVNMDQAVLWTCEAIRIAQFEIKAQGSAEVPPPAQPEQKEEAPKQEDAKP